MTTLDDGIRGDHGLVASLVSRADGTVRLILDDAVVAPSTGVMHWRKQGLYTFIDWPCDAGEKMSLSPEAYQALGESLMARLLAQATVLGGYSTGTE